MLYFAYGSNMDWARMKERCPSAKFVGIAKVADHRLCFPRPSKKQDGGVAGIERALGEHAWGVVYEIGDSDVPSLDRNEGVARGDYRHESCRVLLVVSNGSREVELSTYIATPVPGLHRPSAKYMKHLIDGAGHWGLPPDYQSKLQQIAT